MLFKWFTFFCGLEIFKPKKKWTHDIYNDYENKPLHGYFSYSCDTNLKTLLEYNNKA